MKSITRLRSYLLFGIMMATAYWSYTQGTLDPIVKRLGKGRGGGPVLTDFKFETVSSREMRQTVLATGTVTLEVGAEVKIGSRISGQLEELYVQIGNYVKAGEVIAIVEHADLKARVAQRKAELQAEKARLSKIKSEGPLDINKSRAELEELQVQAKLAKKMLKRNRELNEQGVILLPYWINRSKIWKY